MMSTDSNLQAITQELINQHHCHTIILYGSRARGDFTSASDYDIMAFRDEGDGYRDARLWNGVYLDIFVYPESKLLTPDETLLHIKEGKILVQKGELATQLLSRLQDIFKAGPKPLPADEITARKTWALKMLERSKMGDIEGNFRRIWLLQTLLEDYFHLRGLWYRGSKESFQWLKTNHPALHSAFELADPRAPLARQPRGEGRGISPLRRPVFVPLGFVRFQKYLFESLILSF